MRNLSPAARASTSCTNTRAARSRPSMPSLHWCEILISCAEAPASRAERATQTEIIRWNKRTTPSRFLRSDGSQLLRVWLSLDHDDLLSSDCRAHSAFGRPPHLPG